MDIQRIQFAISNHYNDLSGKCDWNLGECIDGNFRKQGSLREILLSDTTCIIVGQTILPFEWMSSFNVLYCSLGWLYGKNVTKGTDFYISNYFGNVSGLTGSTNDVIVFFGFAILP